MSAVNTAFLHLRAVIDEAASDFEGEEYFNLMRQIARLAMSRSKLYSQALRHKRHFEKVIGGKR